VNRRKYAADRFGLDAFRRPPSFYYPGYFWVWNDKLDSGVLVEQLREMHAQKAMSVCPLPLPKDFRPQTMQTNMAPGYLTKEFLKIYTRVIAAAHQLGMDVWLYDEGGWPSGSACGRVVRSDPALLRQWLRPEGNGYVVQYAPTDRAACPTSPPFPDLLKAAATERFIELTHAQYKKAVGKYFGNTIFKTFTDEPKITAVTPGARIPWTDTMREDFQKAKGYDLMEHLPALFAEPRDVASAADMRTRIDFFDFWSRRFADAYLGKLRTWCRANHLCSGGHIAGGHQTLHAVTCGFGSALRALRQLDIPGNDHIRREIFPGRKNHHYPKYTSSAAHQTNRPWAFTESFAIYGSGLTMEEMTWLTHYQYARGINLMVISCYAVSTKGRLMAGPRPQFGPVNPLWKYMSVFHGYTARLGYLLSLGKPMIRDALYYPVRDLWAGGRKMGRTAKANDLLARKLFDSQCDFDFVDDDVLEDPSNRVVNGTLTVGKMRYNTIWFSPCEWVSEKSMKKLASFVAQGGKVRSLYAPPGSGGKNGHKLGAKKAAVKVLASAQDVVRHVEPLVTVKPGRKDLHVCGRILKNGTLYFIANESGSGGIEANLHFRETHPAIQIDPETGRCWELPGVSYGEDGCRVRVSLPFAGSCVILFTKEKFSLSERPPQPGRTILTLSGGWQCRRTKSYVAGKRDFVVRSIREKLRTVRLGDWGKTFGKEFSGDAEYIVKFKCPAALAGKPCVLDLGKVFCACEAHLNGVRLGRRTRRPYLFPVAVGLRKGINRLSIVVTNTLANQLVTSSVMTDFLNDTAVHRYHAMALQSEQDSCKGGLFGPVRVLATLQDMERTGDG